MEPTIQVGQHWVDLDERNAKTTKKGKTRQIEFREVEVVSLPTLSTQGVMKVIKAPNNPKSVGQLRQFTRGKLLAYYGLVTG